MRMSIMVMSILNIVLLIRMPMVHIDARDDVAADDDGEYEHGILHDDEREDDAH